MSWIGGDIAGLQSMGSTLQRAPGLIEPIVAKLTDGVDKLGDDASWSGEAAQAFRKLWTSDAVRAGGIGAMAGKAGDIIAGLGDHLASLESALYNSAHDAQSRGAQIGADGQPLPLVITGDPTTPAAAAALQAQEDYQAAYAEAKQLAQGFRLDAASDLAGLAEPIVSEGGKGLTLDGAITIGDYLKAFYVVPNDRNARVKQTLPQEIAKSRENFRELRWKLKAEQAAYKQRGLAVPEGSQARLDHLAGSKALDDLKMQLADAQAGKGELPMSQILNTKMSDLKGIAGLSEKLPGKLKFLSDIPVIDVAATGVVAELQAIDDHQKGWSETTAHVNDYAAGAVGLAGGALVAAALPLEAPVVAVSAAAGFAGVAIGGVGYNAFHEHWSEDIHDHGVVAGILHGSGNTLSNTGEDIADMGRGVANTTKSLWKSVFG
ncbi:hypothetical protein [Williamsia serinedens]|uniref:WXG100 family type VII secretion target n=1 Tax=Williamsia serinedens TaxID=391736 RepID=A0ABT1H218_9NOCA|nr:hypothetical protein [Williamsia serinedens]MCP2160812.1 hypothetical protein [Williamsia serinedens]